VVLKLPDWPPVLMAEQLPPPELEELVELELLLDEELEDDELEELLDELEDDDELLDEELEDDELEELLLDELDDEELDELPVEGGPIFTVNVWEVFAPQALVNVTVAVQGTFVYTLLLYVVLFTLLLTPGQPASHCQVPPV
jgi:hypothetical protein